ncbi:hypothetical protein MYX82_10955 [Acidobacteria bacterium AH-259-D05]|nr:hypothetical protein [Acidobacteria bacterium AH-259-D05]
MRKFPYLTRADLDWWEKAGYLKPELIKKRKLSRRKYSQTDLKIIGAMYHHFVEGDAPSVAYGKAIRDLGLENRRARSPPLCEELEALYKIHRQGINSFFEQVLVDKELSLEEICLGALSVLNSPKYREKLRKFMYSLPIEQTPCGKYRYRSKA